VALILEMGVGAMARCTAGVVVCVMGAVGAGNGIGAAGAGVGGAGVDIEGVAASGSSFAVPLLSASFCDPCTF